MFSSTDVYWGSNPSLNQSPHPSGGAWERVSYGAIQTEIRLHWTISQKPHVFACYGPMYPLWNSGTNYIHLGLIRKTIYSYTGDFLYASMQRNFLRSYSSSVGKESLIPIPILIYISRYRHWIDRYLAVRWDGKSNIPNQIL